MGSLTSRVVTRVSSIPTGYSNYTDKGIAVDYAIGGVPFLSGASKERPLVRKTAPYRKDQIDQTPIPGEQSMVFWWLRSQQSFHGGTGIVFEEPALEASILYADPNSATAIPLRYQDSEGIDVFTQPGHVTLLPGSTQNHAAGSTCLVHGCTDANNVDMYLEAQTTNLYRVVEGSNAAITWGGTGTILSMADDGTNYYVADNVGIWKGTLAGGAGAKAWNTGSSSVVVKWAKDRLVACIGLSVYELVGGTPPTLPTPLYTAQKPNYVWTAIEEGPDGIYLAGHDGNVSDIWYVGLTTGPGSSPVLSAPKKIAELPRGEIVYCIKQALGSFLAIGSNKGIRIADFDNSGHISYGPMFVQLPSGAQPVYDITAYDRFIIGAWGNAMADGTSGLIKIDLGFTTQFAHYAYAKDLRAHVAGAVRSVSQYGNTGRLVFSVDGAGSYLQNSPSQPVEATGYLQTGNIRFHTQELKLYKYVKVEGDLGRGSVGITFNYGTTGAIPVGTFTSASFAPLQLGLPTTPGPLEYASLTFTLNRDSSFTNQGPNFYSYQVRALPAQKNQRMILIPIMLFDHETDSHGVTWGYPGYARDRLNQLEALEEARDNIMFQDLTTSPFNSVLAVIDDIEYQQTDPPTNADGNGGYALVTLRTVT